MSELGDTVAIISAIGVVGALTFTSLTLRRDQKIRYYNALKDLIDELTIIYDQPDELLRAQFANEEELKKLQKDLQEKIETFRWKHINFHEKVAHLAASGIIPKSIARYFSSTFQYALFFLDLAPLDDYYESSGIMREWCAKEGIQKLDTPRKEKPL